MQASLSPAYPTPAKPRALATGAYGDRLGSAHPGHSARVPFGCRTAAACRRLPQRAHAATAAHTGASLRGGLRPMGTRLACRFKVQATQPICKVLNDTPSYADTIKLWYAYLEVSV